MQEGGESKFLPVSVEDVANFLELVRKEVGLKDEQYLASALAHLCARVSPLALGSVYRAREQIGMLARKLLALHIQDEAKSAGRPRPIAAAESTRSGPRFLRASEGSR
jgi:hypothetical protein